MAIESTFGMVKPEGLERHLVEEIEERIFATGLDIEEEESLVMSVEQFEMLYGHAKKSMTPAMYDKMKDYLTTNEVLVLKINGESAIEKLLKLRGSSNAKYAAPGTIRGDYARNQDYAELFKKGDIAKNVFHAADSADEAKRDLILFFGDYR